MSNNPKNPVSNVRAVTSAKVHATLNGGTVDSVKSGYKVGQDRFQSSNGNDTSIRTRKDGSWSDSY